MQGVKGLVKQQKRLLQKRHAALQQARSNWQVTTSPAPCPLLCSGCCMGSLMWFCAVVQSQAGTGLLSCNSKHLSPQIFDSRSTWLYPAGHYASVCA